MNKTLWIAGELLVDLIGQEIRDSLFRTHTFRRYAGGSPANLAANLSRLGHSVQLVAAVGQDGLGDYLVHEAERLGVGTAHVQRIAQTPTSMVLLSRSHETPEFIAYRGADAHLEPAAFPYEQLKGAGLFHCTCFALSLAPARETLKRAAETAHAFGVPISLDMNYAPSIWPDRAEARQFVAHWCQLGAWVKVSLDDCRRLFGEDIQEEEAIAQLLTWGAGLVCFTKGSAGSRLKSAHEDVSVPAEPVHILGEATGAGDAFWSGFLSAYLRGAGAAEALRSGGKMAALKLSIDGPMPEKVSLD
ncbi:fructokinase [Nitritalea halalkaliphila LW7]|uniref:Fructokinase n=1 Tax=Nitritalea halalkaliphila LW7 TaxID=1189621 RepID=I5C3S2_9BACT|nr:sugar kinase [Nitritalea halalkaliphila]EIM76474.1 fructokinase [Nitritalea halalkaliphila LW7]